MSKLIKRDDAINAVEMFFEDAYIEDAEVHDLVYKINHIPTASPWHRGEEPPKKHGKYPVCWVENGNFYWQEAHYCYFQDGDKWVAWSSYQGDDVEITPDYWMSIEPPKEDNDG